MKHSIYALLCAVSLFWAPASEAQTRVEIREAQMLLTNAGHDPGPMDGLWGGKTARALEAFLAESGEAFDGTLSENELVQLRKARWGDQVPTLRLDGQDPERFWSAHLRTNRCYSRAFEEGRRAEIRQGAPRSAPAPLTQEVADRITPITPYTAAPACGVGQAFRVPDPIVDVGITRASPDPDYDAMIEVKDFLARGVAHHRQEPGPKRAAVLVTFFDTWSAANALSENIRFPSFDNASIFRLSFDVQELIPALIVAYADMAPYMDPELRLRAGQWVGRLVAQSEQSDMGERQDNKSYLRAQIALLWGIATGDEVLTDRARQDYQNALADMRPDGTFPIDSARGGEGLHYSNRATNMLVALATTSLLLDENWFATAVNGRTVDDAVMWIARSVDDTGLNRRYARSCAGGFGSIDDPEMWQTERKLSGRSGSSWVPLYLRYGRDAGAKVAIVDAIGWATADSAVWEASIGGPMACVFAGVN